MDELEDYEVVLEVILTFPDAVDPEEIARGVAEGLIRDDSIVGVEVTVNG